MDVKVAVRVLDPFPGFDGPKTVSASGSSISFAATPSLRQVNFPLTDIAVNVEGAVYNGSTPPSTVFDYLGTTVPKVLENQSTILFAYGQQGSSRRALLFGAPASEVPPPAVPPPPRCADSLLGRTFAAIYKANKAASVTLQAFTYGVNDTITDLLAPVGSNAPSPTLVDDVKVGAYVKGGTRMRLSDATAAAVACEALSAAMWTHFTPVATPPPQDLVDGALPVYMPDHTVVLITTDAPPGAGDVTDAADEAATAAMCERTTVALFALGDCDRPLYCGVDAAQQTAYEFACSSLSAVVLCLQAIRASRLRVPYTKHRLTSLLKRALNADRSDLRRDNAPTAVAVVLDCFSGGTDAIAEESASVVALTNRLMDPRPRPSGVVPAHRDPQLDLWRIRCDLAAMHDELAVAKAVFDFKPVLSEGKKIENIEEECAKRVAAAAARREDVARREQQEMETAAAAEANEVISKERSAAAERLAAAKAELSKRQAQAEEATRRRDDKVADFESKSAKLTRKCADEVRRAEELQKQVADEAAKAKAAKASADRAHKVSEQLRAQVEEGRRVLAAAESAGAAERQRLLDRRIAERAELRAQLDKLEASAAAATADEKGRDRDRGGRSAALSAELEDEARKLRGELDQLQEFLPAALPDGSGGRDAAGAMAESIKEYLAAQQESVARRVEDERKAAAEAERRRMDAERRVAEQQRYASDRLADALTRERRAEEFIAERLAYCENGTRAFKVSSKDTKARVKFVWIDVSDAGAKLLFADVGKNGLPTNRNKPSSAVALADVDSVALGQESPAFLKWIHGSRAPPPSEPFVGDPADPTVGDAAAASDVSASAAPALYHRSLALLTKGSTVDLIFSTDGDFEAWVCALRSLLKVPRGLQPSDRVSKVRWERPLEVASRPGYAQLTDPERSLCAKEHIAPATFLRAKNAAAALRGRGDYVTINDVRLAGQTDAVIHDFLIANRLIEPLTGKAK